MPTALIVIAALTALAALGGGLLWVFIAGQQGRGPLAGTFARMMEEARARAAAHGDRWAPLAEAYGWRVVPGHEPRDPVVWLGGTLDGGLEGTVELTLRTEPAELWDALAESSKAARRHQHVSVDTDDGYGGPAVFVRVQLAEPGVLLDPVEVHAPAAMGALVGADAPKVVGTPPQWLDDPAVQAALTEAAARSPTFCWKDQAAWLTVKPTERERFSPVDLRVEIDALAALLRAAVAASR